MFYTYEFGDRWVHSVVLVKTVLKTPSAPSVLVIRGEGRCPLEDSGGIDGHLEFLDVLKDTSREEHAELAARVTRITGISVAAFDPTVFDIDGVNEELRALAG